MAKKMPRLSSFRRVKAITPEGVRSPAFEVVNGWRLEERIVLLRPKPLINLKYNECNEVMSMRYLKRFVLGSALAGAVLLCTVAHLLDQRTRPRYLGPSALASVVGLGTSLAVILQKNRPHHLQQLRT